MSVKAILYGQSYTKAEMDDLLDNSLQIIDAPIANSDSLVKSSGIFNALNGKQSTLEFDNQPTQGSQRMLTSGSILTALNGKVNNSDVAPSVEQGNPHPVTSGAVYTAIQGLTPGGSSIIVDDELSSTSENPVQNKVIYDALDGKANSSDLTNYATTSDLSGKAPKNHASSANTYGVGTSSNYGHLKITDDVSDTAASSGIAISPKAVYSLASTVATKQKQLSSANVLPVSSGGTGATTFTSGRLLIGNGTNAIGTRAITNNTSNTAAVASTNIPNMNTLYYTLAQINNADQTRATTIYAPTAGGTANTQALVGNGATTAPKWVNIDPSVSFSNLNLKITVLNQESSSVAIPTGTTASTVAVGNHTHAISLASDTGTSTITLAHGSKYKLTAGGSSVIFTLPSDNNTDIKVKQNLKEGNYSYKLLFTSTVSPTDGTAGETGYNNAITVNPSSGTITATTFAGNASTASSATKLTTGRTLQVDLASTSASTAFNGTAAISDIGVSGVLGAAHGGTGENTLKKSANALINALSASANEAYVTQEDDFIVVQYAGGGTTNTDFYRKSAKNVRVGGLTTARSLKVALGSTSAASFDGTADATSIGVSGTLPVNRGGTGKTSTYLNGVIVGGATASTEGGTSSTEAWQSIRTKSGAFFATAQDAKPSFGTLPVAQGGTGVTSIANLKTALNIANNTTITTTSSKPKLLLTVGSDAAYPRAFLIIYHLLSQSDVMWYHIAGVQYSENGGIVWALDTATTFPAWTPAAASFKINFSEAATCWVLGNCNFTASAST